MIGKSELKHVVSAVVITTAQSLREKSTDFCRA
nr:MAG TPA: hypothetical protein [Caudoviricetes sp.]